jgi:hypothetical protein
MRITALVGIASLATGALAGWWLTNDSLTAKHQAQISALRSQAADDLRQATDRAFELERQHQALANQLEVANAQTRKKLDSVLAENRRLARDLGGLRDPYSLASSCTLPTKPNTASGLVASPAPGRLSDEASEFLHDFAREADRAAEYAATCYDWVKRLTP